MSPFGRSAGPGPMRATSCLLAVPGEDTAVFCLLVQPQRGCVRPQPGSSRSRSSSSSSIRSSSSQQPAATSNQQRGGSEKPRSSGPVHAIPTIKLATAACFPCGLCAAGCCHRGPRSPFTLLSYRVFATTPIHHAISSGLSLTRATSSRMWSLSWRPTACASSSGRRMSGSRPRRASDRRGGAPAADAAAATAAALLHCAAHCAALLHCTSLRATTPLSEPLPPSLLSLFLLRPPQSAARLPFADEP